LNLAPSTQSPQPTDMTTAGISFEISPSDPSVALGVEVWIDQQQIFNTEHLAGTVKILHDIDEDDAEHQLRVVLKNKLPEHTTVDADGDITQDAVINIGSFEFEEIDVNQVVQEQAVYHHNFNGSAADVQDKFFGSMGCNGTLSLKFSTPIYIWLLEHM
jgi:hypothetical protein